jgi:hypothetical protein
MIRILNDLQRMSHLTVLNFHHAISNMMWRKCWQ